MGQFCGLAGPKIYNWKNSGDGNCVEQDYSQLNVLGSTVSHISCKSCFQNEILSQKIYPNLDSRACVRSYCQLLLIVKYSWTSTSCIDCYGLGYRAFDNKTGCFYLSKNTQQLYPSDQIF